MKSSRSSSVARLIGKETQQANEDDASRHDITSINFYDFLVEKSPCLADGILGWRCEVSSTDAETKEPKRERDETGRQKFLRGQLLKKSNGETLTRSDETSLKSAIDGMISQ